MKDLIERQSAIDAVFKDDRNTTIKQRLEALPSAQPEIIHCQDCIHAIEDALCGGYWCKGKAVTSDHYCGYAERRTDELGDS